MKEADIIIREVTDEEIKAKRSFSHFGWEKTDALAFNIVSDGYWNSAKILLKEMEHSESIEDKDSLIYPLFFNYRHSIETYLKCLFFRYGENTNDARSEFLGIGHDLQNLWKTVRPYLDKGKKHVGSSVDMNAIEHYIKSINAFDADSMMMRYPITKDLKANKGRVYHLDFLHLGNRMNKLCSELRQLDDDIRNQVTASATIVELSDFLSYYDKYHGQISHYLSLLAKEKDAEITHIEQAMAMAMDSFLNSDSLNDLDDTRPSCKFFEECDPDLQILLYIFFESGNYVDKNNITLSQSAVERQKEFVRFCNDLLQNHGLCFGKKPQRHQLNIEGKGSKDLFYCISKAVSILDLKDDRKRT